MNSLRIALAAVVAACVTRQGSTVLLRSDRADPCRPSAPATAQTIAACANAARSATEASQFWMTLVLPQQQTCWTPGQVSDAVRAARLRIESDVQRNGRTLVSDDVNDGQFFLRSSSIVEGGGSRQWYAVVSVDRALGRDPTCTFSAVQISTFSTVERADRSVFVESDAESNAFGSLVKNEFDRPR
jgi:hypothetical protein